MRPLHICTPVIQSESFAKAKGQVFLKLENLQPTGSFKIRGLGHLCQLEQKKGAKHFVSSSGGNAGLATAYAARKLSVKATVIVPETTSLWAREKIREQGAEVKVHGQSWAHADELAQRLATKNGYLYVPPFDHPAIFSGNRTIITELKDQMDKPSAIVLSVGGGGLLCGAIIGLKDVGWHDVRVYAAETKGAASFRAAVKTGQPVDIGKIDTVAVTLGAPEICADAFINSLSHPTVSKVVTDQQALQATVNFANNHRLLVEPSCGASLSLLEHDIDLQSEERVLVIVCGGAGVNIDLISSWKTIIKK